MKELMLRGYVTPEDCGGDVQKAVDLAKELDLNQVLLTGAYTLEKPLILPSGMYLRLEDAVIHGSLETKGEENYAFRDTFITLEGKSAKLLGEVRIFNTHHITVTGLELSGDLTLEYCTWGRLDGLCFETGSLKIGMGCNNFIVQNVKSKAPAYIDSTISQGKQVPGSIPMVQNILLQDSCFDTQGPAVCLGAGERFGLQNIQVDHIRARDIAVQVGKGENQNPALYFNLTFTHLDAPTQVLYQNEAKHVYEA